MKSASIVSAIQNTPTIQEIWERQKKEFNDSKSLLNDIRYKKNLECPRSLGISKSEKEEDKKDDEKISRKFEEGVNSKGPDGDHDSVCVIMYVYVQNV